MFILIGGDTEISFRLAEALAREHEVALICREDARGARLDRLDAEVVYGPMMSAPTMRQAGIEKADVFIGCSRDDEDNIVACITARHQGAKRTICFLNRMDVQSSPEERRAMAENLGIGTVILPAQQLAEDIVRIVVTPGALAVQVFEGGQVHLLQHAVEEGAPLTRGTLAEVGLPEDVVLVMGRRDDAMFIPKGSTRFRVGDRVTAMGSRAGLLDLLHHHVRARGRREAPRRATIVGGGAVGFTVARGLEDAGWSVKVIETDRKRCEVIAPLLQGLVLHGDGTDIDLLESERVADDPVVVAVTSNDEKNLLVSLLAKHVGVPRILTRADQQSNERLFDRVGIDVVLSARGAAIESVLRFLGQTRSHLLAEVEHGDAEVIELEIPAEVDEIPLMELKSDVFAIIGAILRDGEVIIPRGADALRGGDRILVFCGRENESSVRSFFTEEIADRGD